MKKYSLYVLVLALLLVITVITLFFVYLSIDVQREKIIEEEIGIKVHLAEIINEILYSPFWIYRMGMFPKLDRALIAEMAKFRNVRYIRVVLTNGTIAQSTISGEWGKRIEDLEILTILPTREVIIREDFFREEKIKSIIYPGYGAYRILIGFSLEGAEVTVRNMIFSHLLVSLSSLILVILVIFLVLRRSVVIPLKKITSACEKIRKGDLNTKIDLKSKNEIGELGNTFNEMISDLRKSQIALKEGKNILKIRVEAKTKELKELNEGLEEEVKKRTKEVCERIKELEKFQKLTVGREMRIIELKKEITKLKEEINKTKEE